MNVEKCCLFENKVEILPKDSIKKVYFKRLFLKGDFHRPTKKSKNIEFCTYLTL